MRPPLSGSSTSVVHPLPITGSWFLRDSPAAEAETAARRPPRLRALARFTALPRYATPLPAAHRASTAQAAARGGLRGGQIISPLA